MTVQRSFQHASDFHGAPGDETNAPPEPRRRRHWLRYVIILVLVGAVIGFVLVALIKLLNDPVVSAGTTAVVAQTPAPATPSLNTLTGLTIEMNYPSSFDEVARVSNTSSAIEQYVISSKAEYRRSIAVTVFPLPTNKVDDDASYKYRLINPDLYTLTTAKVGSEAVSLMTKSDHTERTLFWAHGGKLLIVSITSTASGDNVNDFMSVVMPTIRWRV